MQVATLREHIQRLEREHPNYYIQDNSDGVWSVPDAIKAFEAHEFHRDNLDKKFLSDSVDDLDLPPDYVERLYTIRNGQSVPWAPFYTVSTKPH